MRKGFKKGQSLLDNLGKIEIEELLVYYAGHSTSSTAQKYKVSKDHLKTFLIKLDITIHTKEEDKHFSVLQRKEYCLKYYGVDNAAKVDDFKIKQKETLRKNLGEDYADKIRIKMEQTKLLRYGDSHYNNIETIKNTCLLKYGESCFLASDLAIDKRKKFFTEKYGVEHPMQVPEIKSKNRYTYWKHLNKGAYKYNDLIFDSKPELALYLYCLDNDIEIIREPVKLVYYFKNKKHYYYVDFLVNNELIEIKGDHLYEQMLVENTLANEKYKCLLENNVKLLTSSQYSKYIEYCDKKFGDNWDIKYKNIVL